MTEPNAVIASSWVRTETGNCCSETANANCRFGGKLPRCGASIEIYTACPYSASSNIMVPIYGAKNA